MGGYYNPLPIPRRRRNVRTPPFVQGRSGPYGYPPGPAVYPPSVPPQSPTQAGGSPQPPTPQAEDTRGFGRRIYDFLSNPDTGTYLAGVSNRLLAPRQFGETATAQIMGGLLGGYNDVAARRMMQYQTQQAAMEAARKAGLEEREQRRKESETGSQSVRRGAQSQIEQQSADTAAAAQVEAARKNKAQEAFDVEKQNAQVQEWHDKEQLERDKLVELERNNRERTKNYADRTAAGKVSKEAAEAHQIALRKIALATANTRLKIAEAAALKGAAGKEGKGDFERTKEAVKQARAMLQEEIKTRTEEWKPGEMEQRLQQHIDMFKKQLGAPTAAAPAPAAPAGNANPYR